MRLHLVYRSCAAENRKPRPSFYSKRTALLSCLRSLDASPWQVRITFLNDGELPADLQELMKGRGRIVTERFGSARRSYWGAIGWALRGDSEADLVWLAEDDYLYTLEAFTNLHGAVTQLEDVDYFALYGGDAVDELPEIVARSLVVEGIRREVTPPGLAPAWFELASTTSTFGVRWRTLAADRIIHRLGPISGGAWDHAIMMTLAGRPAFRWSRLFSGLAEPSLPLTTRFVRSIVKAPMRLALNLLALAWRARPRMLVVPVPNLATHLEPPPLLAPGRDWQLEADAVAGDAGEWAIADKPPTANSAQA